ncbi:ABC transporter permease [Sulfurimonas sp.]|uniref:ABC transporter permease n=1 Tax=Sulfurimonas sp. TaxID=2022749 RepID=UPI00356781CC
MFNTILSLALKNAFLRKIRASLLVLMIAVSMSVMLSIEGLYDGMTASMIDKSLRSDSGEITIFEKNYRLKQDVKYSIKNATSIKEEIEKLDDVKSVVTRLKVSGLAGSAKASYPSDLIAVDFKDEEKFGEFSEFIKEGNLKLGKNGCVIGKKLAKNLKLRLNSKVIFTSRDANNNIVSKLFRIKAIVQSTNINIDNKAILAPKKSVYKHLGLDPNSATQIAIRTDNPKLVETIKTKYTNLDVMSFWQYNPLLTQMQDSMVIFNSITFGIVMGVVFIGILGVMYVSILDRIREFGIMLSVGYGYRYIRTQVMLEALTLGLIGFIFGSILSVIFLYYLRVYGLDMSEFSDGFASFGMSSILYAEIKFSYFYSTFFAIMIASVLSVFLPLRKIKKLTPTDVIRNSL